MKLREPIIRNGYAEIPLGKGNHTKVSLRDLPKVGKFNWFKSAKRYVVRNGRRSEGALGKIIYLHRAIMEPGPGLVVDHKNGDTLDNRRDNLRVCTHRQNCRSKSRLGVNNTSGYRGVTRVVSTGGRVRWKAYVSVGDFDSKEEAARIATDIRERVWGKEWVGVSGLEKRG